MHAVTACRPWRYTPPAAQAALAEASLTGHGLGESLSGPAAAAAWARLVHALLCHHPFPAHHQQVAVAAGLQFLSVNGWRADLEPGTAAIVVEGLATGRLSPAAAADWLAPRLTRTSVQLTPYPSPRAKEGPVHALQRALRPVLPLRRGGAGMFVDGRMLARFTGHLLLAQFRDGGAAAQALTKLGASESDVRGAITAAAAG